MVEGEEEDLLPFGEFFVSIWIPGPDGTCCCGGEGARAAASSYQRGNISSSICLLVTAPKNQGACSRYI